MWANVLNYLYISLVIMLSIYGLHALVITGLYLLRFRKKEEVKQVPQEWPLVAVQIPLFNEQSVAERMINALCNLDYPKDRLVIQILDDSTDQTTELVYQRIDHFRSLGFQIEMFHRNERMGYKAGALAEAMQHTDTEFVAIFDADFVPPPDFLRRVLPYFYADEHVGLVQTRWGHLNRDTSVLTRTQALLLDGHQVVEQVARSRSNLLLNFNGTGGVWRTECIRDCGGWQWDTLSEDIDISYRAQMNGWRLMFLPDLIVPGEVPTTFSAFKKQQYRWTFGHIQVFRKLMPKIWRTSSLTLAQRVAASFHLSTNFVQLIAMAMFLLSVPLALLHPKQPSSVGLISMASTGPTILFAVSQVFGYRDGFKHMLERLIHLPVLILIAIGLTISNSAAVMGAITGQKMVWSRTPKANMSESKSHWKSTQNTVPVMVWLEIATSLYCAIGLSLALRQAPELIALTALGMLSFGFVGCSGLVESSRPRKSSSVTVEMVQQ